MQRIYYKARHGAKFYNGNHDFLHWQSLIDLTYIILNYEKMRIDCVF